VKTLKDRSAEALAGLLSEVDGHEMTVLLDQEFPSPKGAVMMRYRHLRFKRPGTNLYWFDLLTWPGNLTIRGDMGTFSFARVEDMFDFFYGPDINPGYWGEKLTATDRYGWKAFSEDRLLEYVRRDFDSWVERTQGRLVDPKRVWQELEDDILCATSDYEAHAALNEFRSAYSDLEFTDSWEWDLLDYTYQFLWCCHAILWGIGKYRALNRISA
jgi:hypothetical protein